MHEGKRRARAAEPLRSPDMTRRPGSLRRSAILIDHETSVRSDPRRRAVSGSPPRPATGPAAPRPYPPRQAPAATTTDRPAPAPEEPAAAAEQATTDLDSVDQVLNEIESDLQRPGPAPRRRLTLPTGLMWGQRVQDILRRAACIGLGAALVAGAASPTFA